MLLVVWCGHQVRSEGLDGAMFERLLSNLANTELGASQYQVSLDYASTSVYCPSQSIGCWRRSIATCAAVQLVAIVCLPMAVLFP